MLFQKHVITAKLFSRDLLESLLKDASFLQSAIETTGKLDLLKGKTVSLLFCEPSTRTCTSFQTAALKLGADVLPIDFMNSSAKKNESLQDTLRTLEQFSDCIVLRHPETDVHKRMLPYLSKPLLNAGDGSGEHPTQALLDVYTIWTEFDKRIDGCNVTFLGDLKHGRTVHSLFQLLAKFKNVTINMVAPQNLSFPLEYLENAKKDGSNVNVVLLDELTEEILGKTDVLYVTRVQRERFSKPEDYDKIKSGYNVDLKMVQKMKKSSIVMHPLPRVDELNEDVDQDPRARYFKQIYLGVFMRASILWNVLGKK